LNLIKWVDRSLGGLLRAICIFIFKLAFVAVTDLFAYTAELIALI